MPSKADLIASWKREHHILTTDWRETTRRLSDTSLVTADLDISYRFWNQKSFCCEFPNSTVQPELKSLTWNSSTQILTFFTVRRTRTSRSKDSGGKDTAKVLTWNNQPAALISNKLKQSNSFTRLYFGLIQRYGPLQKASFARPFLLLSAC